MPNHYVGDLVHTIAMSGAPGGWPTLAALPKRLPQLSRFSKGGNREPTGSALITAEASASVHPYPTKIALGGASSFVVRVSRIIQEVGQPPTGEEGRIEIECE